MKQSSSSFNFPSSVPTELGDFFINNLINNLSNNLLAFSLRFFTGLGGFLHRLIHWFYFSFSYRVRRFFHQVQIATLTHLTELTPRGKAIVMPKSQEPQSLDLPISSCAHNLYQIRTSFLEEESPTRLRNTSSLKNYLQIDAFPIPVLMEQEL